MTKPNLGAAISQLETSRLPRISRDGRAKLVSPDPMKIETLVTVCTHELQAELREWLPTARVCYPDAPLYVATDLNRDELQMIASGLGVHGVHHLPVDRRKAALRSQNVPRWADHWDHGAIWLKIDSLERVVSGSSWKTGGVLLADCDITFLRPNNDSYLADVVLSPNFHGDLRRRTKGRNGGTRYLHERDSLFNAGMLLTRSASFCETWRLWYENSHTWNEETFLEQTALEHVPSKWHTAYFDHRDNFGKWRFTAPLGDERSVHTHLRERARCEEVFQLKLTAQKAAAKARLQLK